MKGFPNVDFYYGVGSRYSYLAATRIRVLEAETGCRVRCLPLFSRDLIVRGGDPFDGGVGSGQHDWPYRRIDAERWAEYYGVPYNEPNFDDYDGRELATACLAAERLGAVAAYSLALFRAVFVNGGVIDAARCADLAVEVGLERAAFVAALADPAFEASHAARIEEAHGRGAFGVPSFFVGERLFWGNDRMVLLRHYLLKGGGEFSPISEGASKSAK